MNGTVVRKIRWFWPWQDEVEESLLEGMSRKKGLLLKSVCPFSIYTFTRGVPSRFTYRLDYRRTPTREKEAYLQLFRDAGWEHVGQMNNWQYFRKPVEPGESPEILTDRESKIQKYRRISISSAVFCIFSLMFLARTITLGGGFVGNDFLICIWAVLTAFFAFATFKLRQRIRRLKTGI